jgi:hypothetical protein
MSLLSQLARAYMANRIMRGSARRRAGRSPWGAPRPRRRGGFYGPFPYYSTRTRRGSRVTVSGCCLPIPLGVVAATGLGAQAWRRRR